MSFSSGSSVASPASASTPWPSNPMLRRKGIRVVSITEQAEDNATGRLLEGIIESVDEYLLAKILAQEVVRGMREAASQRLLPRLERSLRLQAKIKVSDGA